MSASVMRGKATRTPTVPASKGSCAGKSTFFCRGTLHNAVKPRRRQTRSAERCCQLHPSDSLAGPPHPPAQPLRPRHWLEHLAGSSTALCIKLAKDQHDRRRLGFDPRRCMQTRAWGGTWLRARGSTCSRLTGPTIAFDSGLCDGDHCRSPSLGPQHQGLQCCAEQRVIQSNAPRRRHQWALPEDGHPCSQFCCQCGTNISGKTEIAGCRNLSELEEP